jgi:GNAT superfamily N-acetyltransferase
VDRHNGGFFFVDLVMFPGRQRTGTSHRKAAVALPYAGGNCYRIAHFSIADASLLLARWHGEPAGCIAFAPFDEGAVEIHKFYVESAFRGRGIGKALLQAILVEALKGPRSMLLLHTPAGNRSLRNPRVLHWLGEQFASAYLVR